MRSSLVLLYSGSFPVADLAAAVGAGVAAEAVQEASVLAAWLRSARLQVLLPELEDFLRESGQRFFPPVLLLIDRASTIRLPHA